MMQVRRILHVHHHNSPPQDPKGTNNEYTTHIRCRVGDNVGGSPFNEIHLYDIYKGVDFATWHRVNTWIAEKLLTRTTPLTQVFFK